jgi:hypothetical protein
MKTQTLKKQTNSVLFEQKYSDILLAMLTRRKSAEALTVRELTSRLSLHSSNECIALGFYLYKNVLADKISRKLVVGSGSGEFAYYAFDPSASKHVRNKTKTALVKLKILEQLTKSPGQTARYVANAVGSPLSTVKKIMVNSSLIEAAIGNDNRSMIFSLIQKNVAPPTPVVSTPMTPIPHIEATPLPKLVPVTNVSVVEKRKSLEDLTVRELRVMLIAAKSTVADIENLFKQEL